MTNGGVQAPAAAIEAKPVSEHQQNPDPSSQSVEHPANENAKVAILCGADTLTKTSNKLTERALGLARAATSWLPPYSGIPASLIGAYAWYAWRAESLYWHESRAAEHRSTLTRQHYVERLNELKAQFDARVAELMRTEGESPAVLGRYMDIILLLEGVDQDMAALMKMRPDNGGQSEIDYPDAVKAGDKRLEEIELAKSIAFARRDEALKKLEERNTNLATRVRRNVQKMLEIEFEELAVNGLKIEAA
jgi:hypothetical protein